MSKKDKKELKEVRRGLSTMVLGCFVAAGGFAGIMLVPPVGFLITMFGIGLVCYGLNRMGCLTEI